MDNDNKSPEYNPFTDSNVLYLIAMLSAVPYYIYKGVSFQVIIIIVTLIVTWIGWVILQKGKKWSLLTGLIFGLFCSVISFVIVVKIEENKIKTERMQSRQKIDEEFKKWTEKELEKMRIKK